jgi:hypothetical protein
MVTQPKVAKKSCDGRNSRLADADEDENRAVSSLKNIKEPNQGDVDHD